MSFLVLGVGPATFFQDGGRSGLRALGVALSGAADPVSFQVANRLLGNAETVPALEVTLGGLRLRALTPLVIAVTGAEMDLHIGGVARDLWRAHLVAAGEEIELGFAVRGARAYVAVAGGFLPPLTLGSAATDTMSGLGPARLAPHDVLHTGTPSAIPTAPDVAPWRVAGDHITLRVRRGPRLGLFVADAWDVLTSATWIVSTAADRIGVRLDGPELPRADASELPSEGMVIGALQVPPTGRPVILLPDGPVTGGYPVIGVIAREDRAALGQLRPGGTLRLRP